MDHHRLGIQQTTQQQSQFCKHAATHLAPCVGCSLSCNDRVVSNDAGCPGCSSSQRSRLFPVALLLSHRTGKDSCSIFSPCGWIRTHEGRVQRPQHHHIAWLRGRFGSLPVCCRPNFSLAPRQLQPCITVCHSMHAARSTNQTLAPPALALQARRADFSGLCPCPLGSEDSCTLPCACIPLNRSCPSTHACHAAPPMQRPSLHCPQAHAQSFSPDHPPLHNKPPTSHPTSHAPVQPHTDDASNPASTKVTHSPTSADGSSARLFGEGGYVAPHPGLREPPHVQQVGAWDAAPHLLF